jgi:hypothetical protein
VRFNANIEASDSAAQESLFGYGDALRAKQKQLYISTLRLVPLSVRTDTRTIDLFEQPAAELPTRGLFSMDLSDLLADGPQLMPQPTEEVLRTRALSKCFRIQDALEVHEAARGQPDSYIGQAVLDHPRRLNIHVALAGTLFSDIDCYKVNLTAQEAMNAAQKKLGPLGLWDATQVSSSGRGIYLKILLERAASREQLSQWSELQRGQQILLADIGSDKGVRDPARVLRVHGSVNSKSGLTVMTMKDAVGTASMAFVEAALRRGGSMNERARRAARSTGDAPTIARVDSKVDQALYPNDLSAFSAIEHAKRERYDSRYSEFCWKALCDIESVMNMRGPKVKRGSRDTYVLWCLVLLAHTRLVTSENIWSEAIGLAHRVEGNYSPLDGSLLTLQGRICRAQMDGSAGKWWIKDRIYTPSKQFLMDVFEITPDEERDLMVLVSKAEGARRVRAAQRVAINADNLLSSERHMLARVVAYVQNERRRIDREPILKAAVLAARLKVSLPTARKYLRLAVQAIDAA